MSKFLLITPNNFVFFKNNDVVQDHFQTGCEYHFQNFKINYALKKPMILIPSAGLHFFFFAPFIYLLFYFSNFQSS